MKVTEREREREGAALLGGSEQGYQLANGSEVM